MPAIWMEKQDRAARSGP